MAKAQIDQRSVTKAITLTVEVTHRRESSLRVAIAVGLIRLASLIAPFGEVRVVKNGVEVR